MKPNRRRHVLKENVFHIKRGHKLALLIDHADAALSIDAATKVLLFAVYF